MELKVTVENALGIHARPAAELAQLASSFESEIIVKTDSNEIDAKSIMGLLMLAAGKGTELIIVINGSDEDEASKAVYDLIVARKFDEE